MVGHVVFTNLIPILLIIVFVAATRLDRNEVSVVRLNVVEAGKHYSVVDECRHECAHDYYVAIGKTLRL